jgi:predicted transcriptional regulator
MKLHEIIKILNAETLYNVQDKFNVNIIMACGCDLMSDVLSYIKSKALLLTGLTNAQVIYTAENADVDVVCFVRGKKPGREVINLAKEKNIILLATKHPMFESCGLLYKHGLKGCSEINDQ